MEDSEGGGGRGLVAFLGGCLVVRGSGQNSHILRWSAGRKSARQKAVLFTRRAFAFAEDVIYQFPLARARYSCEVQAVAACFAR